MKFGCEETENWSLENGPSIKKNIFPQGAHLLRGPQDVRSNISSYTGPKDRTTQGTTVVPLKSGWDHHVKFYWQKCAIFRAKFSHFIK